MFSLFVKGGEFNRVLISARITIQNIRLNIARSVFDSEHAVENDGKHRKRRVQFSVIHKLEIGHDGTHYNTSSANLSELKKTDFGSSLKYYCTKRELFRRRQYHTLMRTFDFEYYDGKRTG